MIKKLLFVGMALVLAFAGTVTAFADTVQTQSVVIPDIYVRTVHLANTTYAAGDTVTGSFQLINGDTTNVPDVIYEISLAGALDKSGLAGTIYDTKTSDPVILGPLEKRTISFSYVLPKAYSGNLDIHVQAFLKSGVPLGWGDAPITVTGGLGQVNITQANVVIDGTKFVLQAGPMIYPGTTTSSLITTTLSNPTSNPITIIPHIKVYNKTTSGNVLTEYDQASTTIKAKGSVTLSYNLDTFNNTPGVYVGVMTFNDQNGIERAQPISYRYIVSGDIVTIDSMSAGRNVVQAGDTLPIIITYSGSPYDVVTGEASIDNTADLNVKVYNEQDQLVGSNTTSLNFDSGNTITIPLTSAVSATALRGEVTVTKDGKQLASYATNLTSNYDQARQQVLNTPQPTSRLESTIIGVIAIIILILIILFIIKLLRKNKTSTLVIIFALFMASVLVLYPALPTLQAYTETSRQSNNGAWNYVDQNKYPQNASRPNYPGYENPNGDGSWLNYIDCAIYPSSCQTDFSPQVSINSPGVTDTFTPNEAFNLTGTAFAWACDNTPQEIVVTASLNGENPAPADYQNVNGAPFGNHNYSEHGVQFSIPFTAPSTPGTYTLTFRVDNYTNIPERLQNIANYQAIHGSGSTLNPATVGGYMTGQITIVVGTPPPTVTLSADNTSITSGDTANLTWVTGNNPTSCVASDGWTGSVSTTGGTQQVGPLYVTTRYTITCSNAAGSASDSVTINTSCPVSRANTSNTSKAANVLLAQGSGDGGSGSPSDSGSGSGSGSGNGGSPCPGGGGCTQNCDPIATLYANPNPVNSGSATTLTWYSNNADVCTSSDFNTNNLTTYSVGVQSGILNNPPNSSQTFTITCTNNTTQKSVDASVTVNITPQVTVSCSASAPGHPNLDPTTPVKVGTPVTWTATINGPISDGPTWIGTDIPAGASGTSYTITYTSVGAKDTSVVYTPSGGTQQTQACTDLPVNVKPDQVFKEI